jgi:hypothetical protein
MEAVYGRVIDTVEMKEKIGARQRGLLCGSKRCDGRL